MPCGHERSDMGWTALFRTKSIKAISQETLNEPGKLQKSLGVWDLTALGIAAVLGAGVFSTIGQAAFSGGPAVVFLFIFSAIACGFSALCYAEFASRIPIAGSAYTYAYASFGELIAWIIGWDLIMEYAIGNIAMAISWSSYFTGLLASYGIEIPKYLTMNYSSAAQGYQQVTTLLQKGIEFSQLTSHGVSSHLISGYHAWIEAPRFLNFPIIGDLPALFITVIITWVVYIGIEESKKASNLFVILKVSVVLLVIFVGGTYVQPANWTPFAPHGATGVLKGVSAVFFAYIGFDAISTTAEECKDPQRDIPRGMIFSLIICTVLYALTALVLTGVVPYTKLGVADPLAFVFGPEGLNIPWVAGIVNVSALVATATVLLVFQIGQPRIWMVMSRDGLLPPFFSAIHPKYKTPWISTLITGALVGIPALFMGLTEVTDLTSIGTLFAFTLVCGGVLVLEKDPTQRQSKFKTPYINSKYIFPILTLCIGLGVTYTYSQNAQYAQSLAFQWEDLTSKIPMIIFAIEMIVLSYFCFRRNLSLIPVLGLASCSYLISELGITNWIRFGVWLFLGFMIYFSYGVKHSNLKHGQNIRT